MKPNDPRWKVAAEVAPDPLTLRAFLSEYEQGVKAGTAEVDTTQVAPESAAMNLEMSDVVPAAEEVIALMKRVIQAASRSSVRVDPTRFSSKLSANLSRLVYNLGRCAGYREAGRLR